MVLSIYDTHTEGGGGVGRGGVGRGGVEKNRLILRTDANAYKEGVAGLKLTCGRLHANKK